MAEEEGTGTDLLVTAIAAESGIADMTGTIKGIVLVVVAVAAEVMTAIGAAAEGEGTVTAAAGTLATMSTAGARLAALQPWHLCLCAPASETRSQAASLTSAFKATSPWALRSRQ